MLAAHAGTALAQPGAPAPAAEPDASDLAEQYESAFRALLDWSTSRVRLVDLGGFLGALGGFTVGALINGDSDDDSAFRSYSALVLAGGWAGLGLGAYLTRGMAPDPQLAPAPDGPTVTLVPTGRGLGLVGTF